MTKNDVQSLNEVYAVIKPDQSVECIAVTPTVFEALDERFDGFRDHRLVSIYECDTDWSSWERHPAGDEIVVLLSGRATLRLETATGVVEHALATPGAYVVVPRGAWHTARVAVPTRMLFVTPGEGTEHRAAEGKGGSS